MNDNLVTHEVVVIAHCPVCGVEQEDWDGFGVLVCDACGFCAHPSSSGTELPGVYQCDTCGRLAPPPED